MSGCQQPTEEKKEEGAARLLPAWQAAPSRLGRVPLAAWPVKSDRLDPSRAPGGSRATPSGCAGELCERRAAPAVFDNLCHNYTKINVSSSPAYFLHQASMDNSKRCSVAISAFYYSCITVHPGASQSWPEGWLLGLRRFFRRRLSSVCSTKGLPLSHRPRSGCPDSKSKSWRSPHAKKTSGKRNASGDPAISFMSICSVKSAPRV